MSYSLLMRGSENMKLKKLDILNTHAEWLTSSQKEVEIIITGFIFLGKSINNCSKFVFLLTQMGNNGLSNFFANGSKSTPQFNKSST